jgi:hypothetical protein
MDLKRQGQQIKNKSDEKLTGVTRRVNERPSSNFKREQINSSIDYPGAAVVGN